MNVTIQGIHIEVSKETNDLIKKKIDKKISPFNDFITDLSFILKKEKSEYITECNIHFRWGDIAHIQISEFELGKGIELLFDKIEHKINKEKEKHHNHPKSEPVKKEWIEP